MKRYLSFAGNIFYPSAAMGDFIDSFDSLEEAIEAARKEIPDSYGWGIVVDRDDPKNENHAWQGETNDP